MEGFGGLKSKIHSKITGLSLTKTDQKSAAIDVIQKFAHPMTRIVCWFRRVFMIKPC
jgi:hypothetical protein